MKNISAILSLPTITIYVHFVPSMSPHYLVFIETEEKKHSALSLNKIKVSQRLPFSSGHDSNVRLLFCFDFHSLDAFF